MDTQISKSMQFRLSFSLYLNYFVHGIGLIIIAQNMQTLAHSWASPITTVAMVLSGVGLGRFPAYFIFGILADKFGRKLCINIGMFLYLVFFVGMMFTHNIQIAYVLAMFAGAANSALDSGTYTTFADLGGKAKASNVLIKAGMSIGEFVLPLFVAFSEQNSIWYGWSFAIGAAALVVNILLLIPVKFPAMVKTADTGAGKRVSISKTRKVIATVALSLYGYTSMGLMILFTQWITLYATDVLHFTNTAAHLLMSAYSVGSITGVLVIFIMLRRGVPEGPLLIGLTTTALVALLAVLIVKAPTVSMIASFAFGLSAAGGGMQVGLTMFLELYPRIKGLITGIFMNFGSLATFSVPIITGALAKVSIASALRFDVVIAVASLIVVVAARLALHQERSLDNSRKQINGIDRDITRLLEDRFHAVDTIAAIKAESGKAVLDEGREQQVIARVGASVKDEQLRGSIQHIYGAIMAESRAYQSDKLGRRSETETTPVMPDSALKENN
ncbi:MFS transporter [Lacticaseibacillus pabuli]|uniref:MFS transporter n=1 Tax=Lacticaseibacillus pabuli TaxID=3025672 RepID=A0ABY7WS47_9LACO|nr:MFS transporter [Lacticaseibacillus sp. KACC 23028]WDF82992.1 MFS transporter [Lacticaseibacillus sp. KACC 23028]